MPRQPPAPGYLKAATKVQIVPIDDLKTLPGNPRRGDIERIKGSLERFGQRYPSVIREGVLLAGNNRLAAMKELGWTHVVVVEADDLSEDEARAFALADNRTADLATYDDAALAELLQGIDGDLLKATGYDELFFQDLIDSLDVGAPMEPTEDGGVIHHKGGAGMDIGDAEVRWNEAATRMMVLTYDLSTFADIEAKFAKLRDQLGMDTNSDVVQYLLDDAIDNG